MAEHDLPKVGVGVRFSSSAPEDREITHFSRVINKIINIIKRIVYWALGRFITSEGSASPEELEFMMGLINHSGARFIGETGFNMGFSSCAFLGVVSKTEVVSFDTGYREYVQSAKESIDRKFPGRHTLIYGDSKETLPKFLKDHPDFRFDYVFIDGGHDYKTAKADIVNFRKLSSVKTIVIMDDLVPWLPWGVGPTKAWKEAVDEGLISQNQLYIDGKRSRKLIPPGKNGWAVGRYIY